MSAAAAIDVDWRSLGEAAWISALAGLAILLIAGLGVACSLRAGQARARAGGGAVAGVYGVLAVVCVVALAAIVVYGIYLLGE